MASEILSREDLQAAYIRVQCYAEHTPLMTFPKLNEHFGAELWLKCEQFQPIGAFKIRGATNFILQMSEAERKKGVVTHSSGNHAQAVAYVCHHLGMPAYIVMPENSNKLKIRNAKGWGAEVRFCEPGTEPRLKMAQEVHEETGAMIMPSYDHPWIMGGQASCAMEIFREQNDFDYLLAPLGGGGLLSGSALSAHYFSAGTKVIGTEPTQASDGFEGFHSGERVEQAKANTIADGLRTTVGAFPFPVIQKHVDDIWLAEEAAIVQWMYRIWDWTKLIIEPSCAVPFAALDQQKEKMKGKKLAVIVTGGNVDFTELPAGDQMMS